jgi:hypothetical protein
MRKIVATLLKNSSSHSLRVAVMVQGLFSGSLDCQREYHWAKLPNTRTPGAADATSLLYSIYNFEFVVAIVIVQMCLTFMKGLSRSLQERSLEVGRALENVNLVQSSLEDCRENVEQFNRKCYSVMREALRYVKRWI